MCHYNYLQIVGTSGFFANNYLIEEIVGVTGSSIVLQALRGQFGVLWLTTLFFVAQ